MGGFEKDNEILDGTLHHKLLYQAVIPEIIGYSNPDLGDNKDDEKLTSKHLFIFGGTAVSWGNKKQRYVARYIQEAEYVACSMAATHTTWIRCFLFKLNLKTDPLRFFVTINRLFILLIVAQVAKGDNILIYNMIFMML